MFALVRNQGIIAKETRPGKRRKYLKPRSIKHGLFPMLLLIRLLLNTPWAIGDKIIKKLVNSKILKNYLLVLRKDYPIYNISLLLSNIKLVLAKLSFRMLYKKNALLNFSKNDDLVNNKTQPEELYRPAFKHFMTTWGKWLGGCLTNFKRISKRLMNKKNGKLTKLFRPPFSISYPHSIPKLPSLLISTSAAHWPINESQLININNVQIIETNHKGFFGDVTLAMNSSYASLRSFTAFLLECASSLKHTAKYYHKNKLKRYIRRKTRKIYLPRKLSKILRKIRIREKKQRLALKLSGNLVF